MDGQPRFGLAFISRDSSTVHASWSHQNLREASQDRFTAGTRISVVGKGGSMLGSGAVGAIRGPVTAPPGWMKPLDSSIRKGDPRPVLRRTQICFGLDHSAFLSYYVLPATGPNPASMKGSKVDRTGNFTLRGKLSPAACEDDSQCTTKPVLADRLAFQPHDNTSEGSWQYGGHRLHGGLPDTTGPQMTFGQWGELPISVGVQATLEGALAAPGGGRLYCSGVGFNGQLGDGVTHLMSPGRVTREMLLQAGSRDSDFGPAEEAGPRELQDQSVDLQEAVAESSAGAPEGVEVPAVRVACFPIEVLARPGFVAVSCGCEYSLACDVQGRLWAWGRSRDGAMGVQSGGAVRSPQVVGADRFRLRRDLGERSARVRAARGGVGIPAGGHHAGSSRTSELHAGAGSERQSAEADAEQVVFVTGVSCGAHSSLAWTKQGRLFGAGANRHGELGLGSDERRVPRFEEVGVQAGEGWEEDLAVVQASMGRVHAACVTRGGHLYTWGSNADGQLVFSTPDGRDVDTMTPHRVDLPELGTEIGTGAEGAGSGPARVSQRPRAAIVRCGPSHTLAVTHDGRLFAWGSRASGAVPMGPRRTPEVFQCESSAAGVAGGVEEAEACGSGPAKGETAPERGAGAAAERAERFGIGRQREPLCILGGPPPMAAGKGAGDTSEGKQWLRVVDVSTASDHSVAVTACGRLFVWGSSSREAPRLGSPEWLQQSIDPADAASLRVIGDSASACEPQEVRVDRPALLRLCCGPAGRQAPVSAVGEASDPAPFVLSASCGDGCTAIEWLPVAAGSRAPSIESTTASQPVPLVLRLPQGLEQDWADAAIAPPDDQQAGKTQLPLLATLRDAERRLQGLLSPADGAQARDSAAGPPVEAPGEESSDHGEPGSDAGPVALMRWLSSHRTLEDCPIAWTGEGPRTARKASPSGHGAFHTRARRVLRMAGEPRGGHTTRPRLTTHLSQTLATVTRPAGKQFEQDQEGEAGGIGRGAGPADVPSPGASMVAAGGEQAAGRRTAAAQVSEAGGASCFERALYLATCGCLGRWTAEGAVSSTPMVGREPPERARDVGVDSEEGAARKPRSRSCEPSGARAGEGTVAHMHRPPRDGNECEVLVGGIRRTLTPTMSLLRVHHAGAGGGSVRQEARTSK